MNTKYFIYALCVTIVSTMINWSNMVTSYANMGHGSSWSSGSSRSYGGSSGGGHK